MAGDESKKRIAADAILAGNLGEAADEYYGVAVHALRKSASASGGPVKPDSRLVTRRGRALYDKLALGKNPSYETEEELAGLAEYARKMIAKYSPRPAVKALQGMIARRIESASQGLPMSAGENAVIERAYRELPLLDVPLPAFHRAVVRIIGARRGNGGGLSSAAPGGSAVPGTKAD